MKHLGVLLKEVIWKCSCVSDRIEILVVLVFEETGKPEYPEKKTCQTKAENQEHSTHNQVICDVIAGAWG